MQAAVADCEPASVGRSEPQPAGVRGGSPADCPDLPGHLGVLWATAVPLMGLPLDVTHQQYPV